MVYVRGFGGGIFKVEDDGSLTNAFAFDGDKIVPLIDDIVLAVFSLAFGNAKLFSKVQMQFLVALWETLCVLQKVNL